MDRLGAAPAQLAEHLGLTEAEIAARKAYLDFGERDIARLKALHELLGGEREAIVNEFYVHLLAFEPTRALLGDEANVMRLKHTQGAYFDRMTAGDYGPEYVRDRIRVGAVHQRIALETQWYIGAYGKYLNLMLARLWEAHGGNDRFLLEAAQALLKIACFDMTLAIETYMHDRQRRIEQKASQLAALNQVAVAITSSLDVRQVLDEVMQCAVRFTGAYASCIAFFDPARGGFHDWVTHGLSEGFVRNMAFRAGGPAGEAFSAKRHVLSNDLPGTRFRLSALAREEGIRVFVCLPLQVQDDPLGVLYVYRRDRDRFAGDEIDLLNTFAHLAAGAISNARLHARMTDLAQKDGLTAVHNRRSFDDRLAFELQRAQRYGRELTLLALDVDHFKRVNDSHGHQAGDAVLKFLAALLERSVRAGVDLVARVGGEEFAVLLPETNAASAHSVAERIRSAVEAAQIPVTGHAPIRVTVSIGVCAHRGAADRPESLQGDADRALYGAKRQGRNRVVVSPGAAP